MRVPRLNRFIMFLGAVALLLRSAFPPRYYVMESGARFSPTAFGDHTPPGPAGPDLELLVVHLVVITVATLFLGYAMRPASAAHPHTRSSPMVEEPLRGTSNAG